MKRREFLQVAGTCAAHLGLSGGMAVRVTAHSASGPTHRVVVEQPWGRIQRIVDGVWALVSTPLSGGQNAMRTFCNGGIVAGKTGALIALGEWTMFGGNYFEMALRAWERDLTR